jgi:PAS domain S-box-containing protein
MPLVETELNTYELQDRERLLRTIFDHSPDAIFIEDLEGNVLSANPAACRLHGLKHEQLLGMNVWALVPPEYRSSVARQNELVGGEIEGYSLHSSGRSIPVSIRSSNITFRGQPALLLQVRDITERRRAEEAIRQSESRYRLLFDCNPQPMWVHDIETRRFIAINDAALRLYRYSRDEFLLMETVDSILAQPDPNPQEAPKLPNLVEVTTAKHRRKGGTTLTVELTQHTMILDDRLAAFVMVTKILSSR